MRMSHATMYARLLASDASYDGRFFTGVLTTGIYCLPSCKARKPKAENVRFFDRMKLRASVGMVGDALNPGNFVYQQNWTGRPGYVFGAPPHQYFRKW